MLSTTQTKRQPHTALRLSSDAVAFLARFGISPEVAAGAGLYSTEDASAIYPDFNPLPALVIPYFSLCGVPMAFERDGRLLPFVRVRYLLGASASMTAASKPQRYAQPAQSGAHAYLPPVRGIDWPTIAADTKTPLIFYFDELTALKLCVEGRPAIAVVGVSKKQLVKFLRSRGANVMVAKKMVH